MSPSLEPGTTQGGRVERVEPGGAAERAGLREGDTVLEADGRPLADVIDWMWIASDASVDVTFAPAEGGSVRTLTLERSPDEPWGFDFAEPLFDGVRTCRNACVFCFMAQLPPGLRKALYLRDDDFRLSFLGGNFITLTNLMDDDVARIAEQHLSPLYVSLHAVDLEVRRKLVCARDDDALERFDQLLEAGIDLHVQIVLVPGENDGDALEETLTWLAEREGVLSVGIVPVGFTGHQDRISRSYQSPAEAAQVISQVQRWQFAMREAHDNTWVHLADEFYLNARLPFPTAEWYDDFPQYENGIGIARAFIDEIGERRDEFSEAIAQLPAEESLTVVTGMMAATTLAGVLEGLGAVGKVRLLVVPNAFFGGNVSVTGLLAGNDVATGIRNDRHSGTYVLPDVVFNDDGLTIDDMEASDIREQAEADVVVVSSDATGLLSALRGPSAFM